MCTRNSVRLSCLALSLSLAIGMPIAISGCGGGDNGTPQQVLPETKPADVAKQTLEAMKAQKAQNNGAAKKK